MATRGSPLIIAVTGGIASGKSAACDCFAGLGTPLIDADLITRELVQPGQPALHEIAERFGRAILTTSGELDRAAMRDRVFSDPVERRALEAILHPRVVSCMRERTRELGSPYVVLAIPLLVEIREAFDWIDRVLLVDAPCSLQIARVMRRDRLDQDSAQRILAAQSTRHDRLAIAHDVVINDSDLRQLQVVVHRLDGLYRRRSLPEPNDIYPRSKEPKTR